MVRVALVLVSIALWVAPAWAGGVADADAGIARLNAGDAGAAVELFTRAIQSKELSPERLALTYHHRGMAFHQEGQAGRAILDYTTALWNENLPKEFRPRTLNNRGLSFESINDFDSAMRDYNLAIRMNPTYAEAYSNRGNVHRKADRHEDAIADYDMALRNGHPHPKYVFAWQGMSLEGLGRRREAMDAYRRALSIDPNFELAKAHLTKLQENQALNSVLGKRKAGKSAAAPLTLTATPTSQAMAAELNAAPWVPPAPKVPTIVKTPPPPPAESAANPSLRPAFDDQPKGAQAPPAAIVSNQVPPVTIVTPTKREPRSKPAPAVINTRPGSSSSIASSNGEGGSDVEFALQLGSFKSQDLAERGWKAALHVAGDSLDGLSHVIETATLVEKGTVFRLFAEALPDREAALGLCRTLRDKGTPCIVVRR
jgi:tetratricopeptide (TPR) repeat protein